jgi:hypothetical protein
VDDDRLLRPDAGGGRRPAAAGVVSPGFLLVAVGCMAMMAVMMAGMGHGSDRRA